MNGLARLAGSGLNKLFEEGPPNPPFAEDVPNTLFDEEVPNRPPEEDVANRLPDEGCGLNKLLDAGAPNRVEFCP